MQNNLITVQNQTFNSIILNILIKPTQNATLYIIVYQQQKKLQTHEINKPFPNQYIINKLNHQTIYTLKIRLEQGQQNYLQTIHCNTLSDSNKIIDKNIPIQQKQKNQFNTNSEQQLIEIIAAENEDINIFQNKQEIKSLIQRARNNSDARGFIHSEYKVNRPPELKQERLKRIWMISKGQEFFDEVYGNTESGFQFLKNDWFMGPFYSYDANEMKLKQQKHTDDLRIEQNYE